MDSYTDELLSRYTQLVSQCDTAGKWTVLDRFLRFITASMAMSHFAILRELTQIHAWIIRGLNDTYQGTQREEVSASTVYDFLSDPSINNAPYFEDVIISWLGSLYYYCAEQSALDNLGNYYLKLALNLCKDQKPEEYDEPRAFLLSRLMTWTLQVKNIKEANLLTLLATKLAINSTVPTRARCKLAYTLSTKSGEQSKQATSYWVGYVLTNFKNELHPQELMHLLQTSWDGQNNKDSEAILEQIRSQRTNMVSEARCPIDLRALEDKRSKVIQPVLVTALTKENYSFLHIVTSVWYGVDQDTAVMPERVFWQMPLHESGSSAILGNTALTIKRDSESIHITLTEASNRFLSQSVSVTGVPLDQLHVPDTGRFGVPSYQDANSFEVALMATYLPTETITWLRNHQNTIDCQVVVPSRCHPIQALQIKAIGTTWPFTSSFMRPLQDAKICKVAIWLSVVVKLFRTL